MSELLEDFLNENEELILLLTLQFLNYFYVEFSMLDKYLYIYPHLSLT